MRTPCSPMCFSEQYTEDLRYVNEDLRWSILFSKAGSVFGSPRPFPTPLSYLPSIFTGSPMWRFTNFGVSLSFVMLRLIPLPSEEEFGQRWSLQLGNAS